MARKGRSLEILISHLERCLHDKANVMVESPKNLRDRTTGKLREHDVVLTFKHEHHDLIIAIECKDWSKPIGVPQIEAFEAKCRDTGVNRGVIVSRNGFYKTGLKKAKHLNIGCFDINQAKSFDWMLAQGIHFNHRKLLHIDITVIPKVDYRKKPKGFIIINSEGTEITKEILQNNVCKHFKNEQGIPKPGIYNKNVIFSGDGLFLKTKKSKKRKEIKSIIARVQFEVVEELLPFEFVEYRDTGENTVLSTAAIANVDIENFKGKFVMVYDKDKGGTLSFIKT